MKHLYFFALFVWLWIGAGSVALGQDRPIELELDDDWETPTRLSPSLFLDQWRPFSSEPSPYTLDFLRTTDQETAEVTLREAILIGLKNNPGIMVDRLEIPKAEAGVLQEQSVFDPTLNLAFAKDFDNNPSGRRQTESFSVTTISRNRGLTLGVTKRLLTGGDLTLSVAGNRFNSNSTSQVLRPEYQTSLGFTFTQPLLRDFGLSIPTIRIKVAEDQKGISALNYKTRVAELIEQITDAYWNVVFAKKNLAVQRKGIELADALLQEARARVEVGVLAPVAVTEARAEKARREEQVVTAENALSIARETLRLTLNLNPEDRFLPRNIEPVQSPVLEPPEIDRTAIMEEALKNRFEMQAADLDVHSRRLESRLAKNQLLPRLDFQAGGNLNGISGREDQSVGMNNFRGDFGDSVDELSSGDWTDYNIGLTLQIPLGNAAAKSTYALARIEQRQAEARRRDLARQITLETTTEVGNTTTNFKRIQTTRSSRELAAENLEAQQARYRVGLVTQTDLIDFQTRLLEAEAAELQAVTDYNISLARLRRVEGTLLDHFNVEVAEPDPQPNPWWARF